MITLYTAATPNGRKASIMLEEVGLPYTLHAVDLKAGAQKQPGYLAINPNGKIPAIVDHDAGDLPVFESGAILVYLAERARMLLPTDPRGRSQALQWLMFQMSGLGPMQGQANHFVRHAADKIPYAIERYRDEVRRLYGVLDARLAAVPYLADTYSIADVATFPWVEMLSATDLSVDAFPHVRAWRDRVAARPAVAKGMQVP